DLSVELGRNLAREVVVLGDADTAVGEGANVGACVEVALTSGNNSLERCEVDRLAHRGEQQVGNGGVREVDVGVDTEQRNALARGADSRGSALVDRATDGQQHVDALVDGGLGGRGGGGASNELTGERAVGAVPAEGGNARALD